MKAQTNIQELDEHKRHGGSISGEPGYQSDDHQQQSAVKLMTSDDGMMRCFMMRWLARVKIVRTHFQQEEDTIIHDTS